MRRYALYRVPVLVNICIYRVLFCRANRALERPTTRNRHNRFIQAHVKVPVRAFVCFCCCRLLFSNLIRQIKDTVANQKTPRFNSPRFAFRLFGFSRRLCRNPEVTAQCSSNVLRPRASEAASSWCDGVNVASGP